eukprot:3974634-Pyramimonas_sp.AAC.1
MPLSTPISEMCEIARTTTFMSSIFLPVSLPPLSCAGIQYGAISSTCVACPKLQIDFAASQPRKPPPMTVALVDFLANETLPRGP